MSVTLSIVVPTKSPSCDAQPTSKEFPDVVESAGESRVAALAEPLEATTGVPTIAITARYEMVAISESSVVLNVARLGVSKVR